jgi:hypothetical protein
VLFRSSRADLIADFKASMHGAATVFDAQADGDFSRMLDTAALDLGRVRPNPLKGAISVSADVAEYAAPAGLVAYSYSAWSAGKMPNPWAANYPGPEPRVSVLVSGGARVLVFEPAPTALQIGLFGATFTFRYLGGHSIGTSAADTSVVAADRGLLILRAQAEAMREMAMRNLTKPVAMRDGLSGQARNAQPSFLYTELMTEFERAGGVA